MVIGRTMRFDYSTFDGYGYVVLRLLRGSEKRPFPACFALVRLLHSTSNDTVF
jgi:hypothetical protein